MSQESSGIVAVAFDVAGTTVSDDGLVIKSFAAAFEKAEPELWSEKSRELIQYAIDTMGQSKIEVFTAMLGDSGRAVRAVEEFENAYLQLVQGDGISEIPGAEAAIRDLRNRGIKVALTTGFSRHTLDLIIEKLNWRDFIDFSVTPQEAGGGRPSPLMLQAVAGAFGVAHPKEIAAVGDTTSDMAAGVAFGAGAVIGVLTGTHLRDALASAGATSVINSVADIQSLI